MIAPKVVSHVQPTGRDYSGTTSPDLITHVPTPEELALAPKFPQGTPEYAAYYEALTAELAKWVAGEGEYARDVLGPWEA